MSGVHVSAERWIRPLPVGRGADKLDPLAKDVLRELWGCVSWAIEREPVGHERPWISKAEIAEAIGATYDAVDKQVRKLTALGWVRWSGRCWSLAWAQPWEAPPCVSRSTAVREHSSRIEGAQQSKTESTAATDCTPYSAPNQKNHELSHELSQCEHAPQRAPSPSPDSTLPSKTRARRKPQAELDLGADPPPPDDVGELLEHHEQLRAEALRRHGLAVTGWPGKGTGKRKAIEARLRKAIDKHGAEACRKYIEHRAAEWRDDAGPLLAYPPDQTWSPKIVGPTLARLDAQRRPAAAMPRASPVNTRPVVTRPLPRFDAEDDPEETRLPC